MELLKGIGNKMKINEVIKHTNEVPVGDVLNIIKTNCYPFITAMGGLSNAFMHPLFRGMEGVDFTINPLLKISVNQYRTPKDTSPEVHKIADRWFDRNTGIDFRSTSFFATGSFNVAHGYALRGITARIMPIGNFNYCWSPVYEDMTSDFEVYEENNIQDYADEADTTIDDEDLIPDLVYDFLGNGNYQFNTGLLEAIESKHEIMFSCQSALIISEYWIDDFLNK